MGSVHARGDTFLTFGLKALTETNTSRLATGTKTAKIRRRFQPNNNGNKEKYTHRLNKISATHHSDPVESRMRVQCTVATRATAYVTQVCARIPRNTWSSFSYTLIPRNT
jgi:hypothetical protein